MRFPGQIHDAESGLNYNYFRDYEPGTGRYVESDPIGTYDGPSTYGYVQQSPLSLSDPLGLYVKRCSRELGSPSKPATNQRAYNLTRHDYLNVSGKILSFTTEGNMALSRGIVKNNEDPNKGCVMYCKDDKFDKYVHDAAAEVGEPMYCVIAYPFSFQHMAGARNCQTWVDDVLKIAKREYLKNENCPECFK